MSAEAPWSALSVILPLAAAAVATVLGRRGAVPLFVATAGAVAAAAAAVAWQVWRYGAVRHLLGGWGAPLGIELRADGLAALLLCVTAGVGVATGAYATAYFRRGDDVGATYFWPLWYFAWAALNALYLSDDLFNLYVTVELLGLAAIALVTLGGGGAVVAGMRYLVLSLVGTMLFLLGVALIYGAYGTLSLLMLAGLVEPDAATAMALAALTVGLAMKTALFPLHAWLPPAHAGAPAPASALLSALVVKASFYVLLRLWLDLTPGPPAGAPVAVLGALGAGAVLWGSFLALRQKALKRLIAYSTVAQLGYLFVLFPLLWPAVTEPTAAATAWQGGVYHVLSHALAKAAMFLAAGSMILAVGRDRVRGLAGIGHRLPLTFTAFGLGGLSLAGLPPSGGFVAKWLLVESAFRSGQWWWAAVLVAGGLLAAGYVYKVLRSAFERAAPAADRPLAAVPLRMELAALALGLAAALLGVWATGPLALLGAAP